VEEEDEEEEEGGEEEEEGIIPYICEIGPPKPSAKVPPDDQPRNNLFLYVWFCDGYGKIGYASGSISRLISTMSRNVPHADQIWKADLPGFTRRLARDLESQAFLACKALGEGSLSQGRKKRSSEFIVREEGIFSEKAFSTALVDSLESRDITCHDKAANILIAEMFEKAASYPEVVKLIKELHPKVIKKSTKKDKEIVNKVNFILSHCHPELDLKLINVTTHVYGKTHEYSTDRGDSDEYNTEEDEEEEGEKEEEDRGQQDPGYDSDSRRPNDTSGTSSNSADLSEDQSEASTSIWRYLLQELSQEEKLIQDERLHAVSVENEEGTIWFKECLVQVAQSLWSLVEDNYKLKKMISSTPVFDHITATPDTTAAENVSGKTGASTSSPSANITAAPDTTAAENVSGKTGASTSSPSANITATPDTTAAENV
jgi:hypothetical protein